MIDFNVFCFYVGFAIFILGGIVASLYVISWLAMKIIYYLGYYEKLFAIAVDYFKKKRASEEG